MSRSKEDFFLLSVVLAEFAELDLLCRISWPRVDLWSCEASCWRGCVSLAVGATVPVLQLQNFVTAKRMFTMAELSLQSPYLYLQTCTEYAATYNSLYFECSLKEQEAVLRWQISTSATTKRPLASSATKIEAHLQLQKRFFSSKPQVRSSGCKYSSLQKTGVQFVAAGGWLRRIATKLFDVRFCSRKAKGEAAQCTSAASANLQLSSDSYF